MDFAGYNLHYYYIYTERKNNFIWRLQIMVIWTFPKYYLWFITLRKIFVTTCINVNIALPYVLQMLIQNLNVSCRRTCNMKISMTYRMYFAFYSSDQYHIFVKHFKWLMINNVRFQIWRWTSNTSHVFLHQNSSKVYRNFWPRCSRNNCATFIKCADFTNRKIIHKFKNGIRDFKLFYVWILFYIYLYI